MPSICRAFSVLPILIVCAVALALLHGQAVFALSDAPVWLSSGEQVGGLYGYSVASAGDVNADGFYDVVVGVPRYDDGVYREGAAFVFHGSSEGLSTNADWSAGSTLTAARFGHAVSSAGDVNGDGYDDVILGAYRYNNGQPEEGAAFLYYGSESGLVITPTWMVEGGQTDAHFGYAVTSAGDVNGDGFDDVIVGARWFTEEQSKAGAAFAFYGSQDGLRGEPDWAAYGDQVSGSFGYAVGGGGDLNSDGYDDVVVGAPTYDTVEEDEGAVFLYYGSKNGLSEVPVWIEMGEQPGANLGVSVAIVPDMNLDGRAEVAAGAYHYSGKKPEEGAVFLFLGRSTIPRAQPDWTALGGQESSGYGISVRGAGDVNSDGYGDLLVGAHHYSKDQPEEGAVFLYYGAPLGIIPFPAWRTYGNKAETAFGFAVAGAGDVNGDGCDDVIAGAPEFRINKVIMGRAFQYNGTPGEMTLMYLPIVSLSRNVP